MEGGNQQQQRYIAKVEDNSSDEQTELICQPPGQWMLHYFSNGCESHSSNTQDVVHFALSPIYLAIHRMPLLAFLIICDDVNLVSGTHVR